jgi:HK97 family phage prohead protease
MNYKEIEKLPFELFYLPFNDTQLSIYTEEDQENGDPNSVKVKGYAAKFNIYSNLLIRYNWDKGEMEEVYHIIKPGAFDNVMKKDLDVIFTKNHDWNNVIGRYTKKGEDIVVDTLKLGIDEIGLYFEANLSLKHTYASDLIENIKRKEISANSFAVNIDEETTEWDKYNDKPLKIINNFSELRDVSPVIFPAFPNTELTVASYRQYMQQNIHSSEKIDDIYYKELYLKLIK